ncbi:zona pellucida sperm-binding protein 3 receptor-like isoform X1 [Sparus aurata]|uniref:C4b-binding protein alpha chain-like n=1 Tax=Sparus aurata TaxID=8175 RepID=A0A671WA20_SPAAU|nr:zona pellucida sperm-binding protein 3 receptor-like isoform X1 [Sparus aurata]
MGVTDFLLLSCLGFAITAHAQNCAKPTGGPNMHLKGEDILKETFADGDRAAFECAAGYMSAGGSSSITCTAGSWSTVTLKCERKNCGSPGEVPNGQIHYPQENLFGDYIEITCNEGYRLVGNSRITCGAQGWMGRLPRCEVAKCDEAPQVTDATFTPYKDPYDYGDVVQYSCRNGLTLNGSASIECSDDGTFKPAPPICTRVQCEDLDIPNLDWISGSRPPHGYKAILTYRCRTGYRMVGQPTLTCDINSKWSPGLPRCEMVTCNPPHLVVNGTFNPVKDVYKYGDRVQYSCNTNFRLSGSNSASCSDDGTFKPGPPTCTMIICNPPPPGANRIISPVKEVYKYKDVVQYTCPKGFKLSGSNSASCSDDGTFKPAPPTCTMMTCNRPLPLEHGSFSPVKASYTYKDVVQYSCQTGFKLSGTNSVSCSDDGTFKPEPPTCTKFIPPPQPDIYCEVPHVEHGYLVHDDRPLYRPNDKVTFKCRSFYDMEGDSTLTCQADGQWSPPPPKCAYSHGKVAGVVVGVIVLVVAGAAGAAIYKKKKKQRFRKNNNGNSTNDKGGKSVGDAVGLMETPTGNGQTTEDKLPVGSANEV